jgi:4-amino-4-deoxy-L-arabinose transferase-like glycosyltransferase
VLLRAILAALLPLSGDEAYYWDCSRHLDWSYFDMPPLTIWGISAGRAIFGETALAVRFPALVSGALTGFFLFRLIRSLGGGARDAARAWLVVTAMPIFFVGFFYTSTDAVLGAAYVAAVWAAVAISRGDRRGWWGFAVACGLGFLGKFPVVLAAGAMLGAMTSRRARADLTTPTPYLAALVSIVLTSPVWIWAAAHGGDNLAFQLAGRHAPKPLGLSYLARFAIGNLLWASPPILAALAVAWWRAARRSEPAWRALAWGAAAPFALFGAVALKEEVGAHWGGPGLLAAAAALALSRFRWRGALEIAGAAIGVALVALLLSVAVLPEPWIRAEWRWTAGAAGGGTAKLAPLVGDGEIAREVERRLGRGELAASASYSDVHEVAFRTGGRIPVRFANIDRGTHGLASLYWYRPAELVGRDVLFFTEKPRLERELLLRFATVREEAPLVLSVDGREVRRVRFYRCGNLLHPEGAFTRLAS